MKPSPTKTLIMNIGTGIIVTGVLVLGYWILVRKQGSVISEGVTTANVAEQTIVEGTDLARTIKDLSDLNSAVLASVGIFKMQSFRALKDFSVAIPEEPVGRGNPFVPTEWKIKLAK